MNIVEEVKKLGFPKGSYIVFGSGPLAVHGTRETSDIDLLVNKNLYKNLKEKGWKEKVFNSGIKVATHKNVEAGTNWNYGTYNPSMEELLETADYFDDVPFANLREVIKWKRAFGREKDLKDIKLIKEHLKTA
jgi:hypothetical protein